MKIFLIISLFFNIINCKNYKPLLHNEKEKTKIDLIIEAIKKEDMDFLNSLSEEEINSYFEEGNISKIKANLNPFHWSLLLGSRKIIKLFLDKGADPNILTKDNIDWMNLLFIERRNINKEEKIEEKFEIIIYLLDKAASIISPLKERGKNFLHYLTYENFSKKQYNSILKHIKEEIDYNIVSFNGNINYTPFSSACIQNNVNFINVLLTKGGFKVSYTVEDLKKAGKEEFKKISVAIPIISSIILTRYTLFNLLFEKRINIEFLDKKILEKFLAVPTKSKFGNQEEKTKILKKILKNIEVPKEILSKMFIYSLSTKYEEMTNYLLHTYPQIDINVTLTSKQHLDGSIRGYLKKRISAIALAIRNCNVEIVRELIKRNVIVEDFKDDQISPLLFIFRGLVKESKENLKTYSLHYNEDKALEILKILKENGVNLNKKFFGGTNLLELAIRTNNQKIANYLLEQDFKPSETYALRISTPYTDAIIYGQTDLFIKIFDKFKKPALFKKKGNINEIFSVKIKGENEINLLNIAAQTHNEEIVFYLLEKGASPFEKNLKEINLNFDPNADKILNLDSNNKFIKDLKTEKDLNALEITIQNTDLSIFNLILLKAEANKLITYHKKIVSFIRSNFVFDNKTFTHNIKEGFFGVLKFILINIDNEFKDLQPYINYIENDKTSLDILDEFFKEEKEIIELFKKYDALKFNEIQKIEKEKKRKEALTYLILNEKFEEALSKIDQEPHAIYEANENNTTPLIACILMTNKYNPNNFPGIIKNLFTKIMENIKDKQEINRIDIYKKSALSYLIESKITNEKILEELILKGANINFRYGKKYHFIIDIIESQKSWEQKETLIDIFKKHKEKLSLVGKDFEKLSKIYSSSKEKDLILKTLKDLIEEDDLISKEPKQKAKNSYEEIKILSINQTNKFKKNFERTSLENRAIIKEQINNFKNNIKIDSKLIVGLETKIWEIRKDKIRIFYFINDNILFLIDLEDNKHQDSLPNAYYKNLAVIKKQILDDIKFSNIKKYERFE